MAHRILGVDLGAYSVKVAVLETGFRKLVVTRVIERRVPDAPPPPPPTEGETAPPPSPWLERALTALGHLLDDEGLRDGTTYGALGGERVSLRVLRLPFTDARKIEQVLGFELESQILPSIDELVYD